MKQMEKVRRDKNGSNDQMAVTSMQNESEEVTPVSNRVSNDQLKEATSQWNMTKEMGVTCGTERDKTLLLYPKMLWCIMS